MRKTAIHTLAAMMETDSRLVFIGSDLKHGAGLEMRRAFPGRFFMEGISEGHVIGMASGLSLEGKQCYVAANAAFLVRRAYEQLYLDAGLHKANVRLLAHGGGMLFAPLGPTHTVPDDFALMRSVPNMTVIAPCDVDEVARLMPLTAQWEGPIYIRCGKGKTPVVSSGSRPFSIGRGIVMREERAPDVLLAATGIGTPLAMCAARLLEKSGYSVSVLHMHTVKPLDTALLLEKAEGVRCLVTVEEHMLSGGLGSAVAETLLEAGLGKGLIFRRFGLGQDVLPGGGSQEENLPAQGFSAEALCSLVIKELG